MAFGWSKAHLEKKCICRVHSAPIRNLIKLKGTAKLTVQGEQVCLKDSKYVLFEILEIGHGKAVARRAGPDLAICPTF